MNTVRRVPRRMNGDGVEETRVKVVTTLVVGTVERLDERTTNRSDGGRSPEENPNSIARDMRSDATIASLNVLRLPSLDLRPER
jgi:hypothetical protein